MPESLDGARDYSSVAVDEEAELPEVSVQTCTEGEKVLVRAVVPEPGDMRTPKDVCCVIDVSGSMGTPATHEVDGVRMNSDDGMTVMDIVKHATKTVIAMLGAEDRLSIVSFSATAQTVLELTPLDDAGRTKAITATMGLTPGGQTNLWDGLKHGMDTLRTADEGRQQTVLLLTDGQPNIAPPRGHVHELNAYREEHGDFTCQLMTFGFGYSLDSELLLDLAVEGAGTFAFMPDAPFVGTVFVNTVANVLSNHTPRAKLHLSVKKGEVDASGLPHQVTSWGTVVDLGPLQLGQKRDVVVRVSPGAELDVVLEYGSSRAFGKAADLPGGVRACELRSRAMDAIKLACKAKGAAGCDRALAAFNALAADMSADQPCNQTPAIAALCADVAGRVTKAVTGADRFKRWGGHYLRSLGSAHSLQQCTNMVDPGVQVYHGDFFAYLREDGDQKFRALPPPEPARPLQRAAPAVARGGYATQAAPAAQSAPAPQVDMDRYYAGFGGCFAASSTVFANGVQTPVSAVQPGDVVAVSGGEANVRCVVQSAFSAEVVSIPGGPTLTPGHPVRSRGVWGKPVGVLAAPSRVYNFVLDSSHVLLVDGTECVTLGHGLTEPGVAHPYYGSRVIADLAGLAGWEEGRVEVAYCVRQAGHICGLAPVAASGVDIC